MPPTHSDLFLFLRQEELLSGCTIQHIGQNWDGDRPRKGLGKWLERAEWLESYEELDESETLWSMVRVRYEIVVCWAEIPVFKWRTDTPARPPEGPPPQGQPAAKKAGKSSKQAAKARRKKRRREETAASSKEWKGHKAKDWTDTEDSDY